jgi:nucleoside-diphosphate-sugar epimerase
MAGKLYALEGGDQPGDQVLVTGGSGFVASHVVRELLAQGYRVRASVRSVADAAKTAPLRALAAGAPGTLELVEADLMRPGSFDEAVQGCRYVFHVAAPFLMPEQIRDGQKDVVEPALNGTRTVLEAVEKAQDVERVVLTSTLGAVLGDYADILDVPDRIAREDLWNTSSTVANNPYHFAKTAQERLAWEFAGAQDRWSLVTVNPGLVLGPSVTPSSNSGSLFVINELMNGYFFFGAPNFSFAFVDVREVALAHVRAAQRPQASGRYILARPEMVSFLDMGRIIRGRYPRRYIVPRHPVPDAGVRILGPLFGLTKDYVRKHLGIRFGVDSRRSVDELGIDYRPVAETVLDHYEAWKTLRRA